MSAGQGHRHMGGPSMTQNQGNVLGDRPCVRQSKLYREHVGGNAMKELMGQDSLKWDTERLQGAYTGASAKGPASEAESRRNERSQNPPPPPVEEPQQQRRGGRGSVQQPPPQQTDQAMPGRQQSDAAGVDAMKHRPGAGVANRQTFNIFGGN